MHLELDRVEQRVIGSLLEKERTVPDTYPMTLNGVRTACNQASGRDPVLALSDTEEPLVRELERRPGQKEQRWIHLLGPVSVPVDDEPATSVETDEVSRLRSGLAEAHAEIALLQQLVDDLTTPPR